MITLAAPIAEKFLGQTIPMRLELFTVPDLSTTNKWKALFSDEYGTVAVLAAPSMKAFFLDLAVEVGDILEGTFKVKRTQTGNTYIELIQVSSYTRPDGSPVPRLEHPAAPPPPPWAKK